MEHIITLSDKQEGAALDIVTNLNTNAKGEVIGTLTIDKWMKDIIIAPIKQRIRELDNLKLSTILTALPDATNSQINQIKTILGV